MAIPPTKICPLAAKYRENISSSLYDEIVTVLVGPQKTPFKVFKGLICYYSAYFRGAFTSELAETHLGVVTLSDEKDDQAFRAFHLWIFSGKICDDENSLIISNIDDADYLSRVYIFAEANGIPLLKNHVLDLFLQSFPRDLCVPIRLIIPVYENTPEDDQLRRLLVDLLSKSVRNLKKFFMADGKSWYCREFLLDLSIAYAENRPRKMLREEDWEKVNKCDYHDHTDINAIKNSITTLAEPTTESK